MKIIQKIGEKLAKKKVQEQEERGKFYDILRSELKKKRLSTDTGWMKKMLQVNELKQKGRQQLYELREKGGIFPGEPLTPEEHRQKLEHKRIRTI